MDATPCTAIDSTGTAVLTAEKAVRAEMPYLKPTRISIPY